MGYIVTITRQLPDCTYKCSTTVFKNIYPANQYYNDMAQDETVVNIEMEEL